MSVRTVILLGLFLVAAALVHGGIYSAGQDFVLNRFTGRFQFVPAEGEDEETTPTRKASVERRAERQRAERRAERRLLAASDFDRLSGQRLCPPLEPLPESS